ncbi:MAG: hypothetical protein HOV81_41550, partial [Kofleriaceae bacterium]|nr:hypothetical protein [Kofleriaceae bacterium]
MRSRWLVGWSFVAFVAAGAGCAMDEDYVDDPEDATWLDGKADGASGVNVKATNLDVDLAARTAVATIELEKAGSVALEASGLTIKKVTDSRGNRRYKIADGKLLVSNVLGKLV